VHTEGAAQLLVAETWVAMPQRVTILFVGLKTVDFGLPYCHLQDESTPKTPCSACVVTTLRLIVVLARR
jgi:hypothetical protein